MSGGQGKGAGLTRPQVTRQKPRGQYIYSVPRSARRPRALRAATADGPRGAGAWAASPRTLPATTPPLQDPRIFHREQEPRRAHT